MNFDSPQIPFVNPGEFALLRVVSLEEIGTFLDWGLDKDLFLPFSEQTRPLRVGQKIVVFVYLDKANRPTATMRLDKYLSSEAKDLKEGDAVQVLIADATDLGVKAIIENRYWGLIYLNEIFKPLHYGERTQAFVKKIREGGKVDLRLDQPGHQAANLEIGPRILEMLQEKDGFLPITDKTAPEVIYNLFGASKKKFKIALGDLYKKRKIQITDEGIQLAGETQTKKD